MSLKGNYQRIKKIIEKYLTKLESISDEQWQATPPIGGWSYCEVYFHIFDSSILTNQTMLDSATGNGEKKPTHFIVKLILFMGVLPPGKKFKAPKRLAERLKKVSKAEARQLIENFLKQLEAGFPQLIHADPTIKTPHPRMGYFNAFQWLRFMGIHLNHHLKQLDRIEKSF
ncbi:MAG: DinB family protein [Pedobacter sp.]|nr:MAG: DinB family protein [Pedobacter sp.]